jgi:hypothetical protein
MHLAGRSAHLSFAYRRATGVCLQFILTLLYFFELLAIPQI